MIIVYIKAHDFRLFKLHVTKGQLNVCEMPIIFSWNEPSAAKPSLNPKGNQGKVLKTH